MAAAAAAVLLAALTIAAGVAETRYRRRTGRPYPWWPDVDG
jgi:hypothetical protein